MSHVCSLSFFNYFYFILIITYYALSVSHLFVTLQILLRCCTVRSVGLCVMLCLFERIKIRGVMMRWLLRLVTGAQPTGRGPPTDKDRKGLK